jgi:hypothetical protein
LTTEGDYLAFRFTRPTGLTDVTYSVEISTDLAVWTPWPVAPIVESTTATAETLLTLIPVSGGKQFVKLAVTQP